jgi:putative ABC transport system substrate-binding protein
MRRRDFIAGVGGTVAFWPEVLRAQQVGGKRVVAVMTNTAESDQDERSRVDIFRGELQKLGWREETNIRLEYRWTAASTELAKKVAAEFVRMKPDVIFVVGTTTVSIVLEHTKSIPVIFVTGADPVKVGFVNSFANPGGNATGFADLLDTISGKWLQYLKEIAPTTSRVLVLHTDSRATITQLPALQTAAAHLGVELLPTNVHDAAEIQRALDSHAGEARVGVIVPPSSVAAVYRNLIIARVAQHGFPAMYPNRRYPAAGGLMSYAGDRVEQYRRSAAYADRILKGEKPLDLPVRLQDRFELVLNRKTAKALALDVPRIWHAGGIEIIE